jgi:uncharacterized membrane protein
MTDNLPPSQPSPVQGFDFNHPTIISLLYLASAITGLTGIVGVILAFVWRGEPHEAWEDSHFQYLINTFWIALVGTILGIVLSVVLIGFLILAGVFVLFVVRSVLSLLKAQKREPMPNPGTWLA